MFKSSWYLWFFPIAALGISVWLFQDYRAQRGPTIKIYFDDAAGIQPAKTKVRYRGVAIGTVSDVYLSPDREMVVAEVVLRSDAKSFAVEGTTFSMVLPKVSFQGISGLETIFEGTYISANPGSLKGKFKAEFKARAETQATDPVDDTTPYYIRAANVESVSPGDSVTYRGLKVGSVNKLLLAKESQAALIQINIENRYTKLIRTNTVFWRKLAVHAKFSIFGSEVKVNSMDSIMNGGVELATPNDPGEIANSAHSFTLSEAPPKDLQDWNPVLTFGTKKKKKASNGDLASAQ